MSFVTNPHCYFIYMYSLKLGTIIPEQALHGRFKRHVHPIYRIALHCFNVYISCSFFCPKSFYRQELLRWTTKKGYRTSLNTAISVGDNCTKHKIWSCWNPHCISVVLGQWKHCSQQTLTWYPAIQGFKFLHGAHHSWCAPSINQLIPNCKHPSTTQCENRSKCCGCKDLGKICQD